MTSNAILDRAIYDIFGQSEKVAPKSAKKSKGKAKVAKQELELALTVMLVDLAGCDQQFDQREYKVISDGLRRVFDTSKLDVVQLVNRAQNSLAQLRGVSGFASLLKDNLSEEQRLVVMEVIEDVIQADGVEDGFETYLRHKFAEMLDIKIPEKKSQENPLETTNG